MVSGLWFNDCVITMFKQHGGFQGGVGFHENLSFLLPIRLVGGVFRFIGLARL